MALTELADSQIRKDDFISQSFKVPEDRIGKFALNCIIDPVDLLDDTKSFFYSLEKSVDSGKTWQLVGGGTWNGGNKLALPGKMLQPRMRGTINLIKNALVRVNIKFHTSTKVKFELDY